MRLHTKIFAINMPQTGNECNMDANNRTIKRNSQLPKKICTVGKVNYLLHRETYGKS